MTKQIEKIIDRLILAQNIYNHLVLTIEYAPVKDLCDQLLSDKVRLLAELSELAEIDLEDHTMSTQAMIKLELGKIRIEINDLLTANKHQETLDFSIIRENELMGLYKNVSDSAKHNAKIKSLLDRHIMEIETSLKKLVLVSEFN